jgi:hypothetical protein
VHIEELPARVREAVCEFDRAGGTAWSGQFVIVRVTVDLEHAVETPEMILEMRPPAIRRVKIDDDWWRRTLPGPVIHRVAPDPSDPRSF